MRVYFHTHDPLLTMIYTDQEAIDLFGEDSLEEDGQDIPDELVTEFVEAQKRFYAVTDKLAKLRKENT